MAPYLCVRKLVHTLIVMVCLFSDSGWASVSCGSCSALLNFALFIPYGLQSVLCCCELNISPSVSLRQILAHILSMTDKLILVSVLYVV